jgi:hypothetical protein
LRCGKIGSLREAADAVQFGEVSRILNIRFNFAGELWCCSGVTVAARRVRHTDSGHATMELSATSSGFAGGQRNARPSSVTHGFAALHWVTLHASPQL